jgi:hypothetical protein
MPTAFERGEVRGPVALSAERLLAGLLALPGESA